MLLGIGFLLLVSLALSAALSAVSEYVGARFAGFVYLAQILNLLLSVGVITVLFAMIYKYLPDVKLAWRDVWVGAFATSLLFTLGKTLIGLYLGTSSVTSGYGAAGSVVVLLVWVYYSAQILLLGAEFTQVYAERYGADVQPADNAMYTPDHEQRARARLGKKATDDNDDEKRFRMPPLPGGHRPQNV
jgi:membrane protein